MNIRYKFIKFLLLLLTSCNSDLLDIESKQNDIYRLPNNNNVYSLHISVSPDKKEFYNNRLLNKNLFTVYSKGSSINNINSLPFKNDKMNKELKTRNLRYVQSYEFADYLLSSKFEQNSMYGPYTYKNIIVPELNSKRSFFILNNNSNDPVDTILRDKSEHALIYVDNRTNISLSDISLIGKKFDHIYPIMHNKFGIENDTDNNGKVIIVISNLGENVAGYFSYSDKYSRKILADSNEGDIFYINSEFITPAGMAIIYGTLAHEFQHMIYFDKAYDYIKDNIYTNNLDFNSYSNIAWLNEGLAMLAELVTGNLDTTYYTILLQKPEQYLYTKSLTNWTNSNYGLSGLFSIYLYDRFGEDIIKKIYEKPTVGIKAIEYATLMDFNDLFIQFAKTLVFSNSHYAYDPIYNFKSINLLKLQPGRLSSPKKGLNIRRDFFVNSTVQDKIYPYSLMLYEWIGNVEELQVNSSSNIKTVILRK